VPKLPAQRYDWNAIQRLYEDGRTAYAIAQMEGMPTKQAISYRAKRGNWDQNKVVAQALPPLPTISPSKATPECVSRILSHLRNGATLRLACAQEGITDAYLRDLRNREPALDAQVQSAMAAYVAGKVRQIETAADRDWKAAAYLVDRHPLAREEYRTRETTKGEGGIQIVLNIQRDEHETIDVTPDNVQAANFKDGTVPNVCGPHKRDE
jgi:hypothetical protein